VNIWDLELGIMETEEEKDQEVGDVEKREGIENLKGMVDRKLVRSHSPCNLSSSRRSSDTSGSSLKCGGTKGEGTVDKLMKVALMSMMEDKKQQRLMQQQMQQQQAMLNLIMLNMCQNVMPAGKKMKFQQQHQLLERGYVSACVEQFYFSHPLNKAKISGRDIC